MSDKDFVVKNGLVVGSTATINGIEIDPSGATENQILKFDGSKFTPATNTAGGVAGSTYAATIGNGTDTDYTVTHNLGTRDVVVVARNATSPYEQIDVRWEATSLNTVKFDFSSPPSSNSVRVAVYAAVVGNTLATTTVSINAPENSTEGDLWFDSNSAGMFVYYDSQWIEIGTAAPPVTTVTKYTEIIGNGASSYSVVHNLNTRDLVVEIYDNSTYETVTSSVARTTLDTITVSFAASVSANAYTVVVMG